MKNLSAFRVHVTKLAHDKKRAISGLAIFLFILLLSFINYSSFGQVSGDYRSNSATMGWSAAASWQKYNGVSWNASVDYPGQNSCSGCTVTIQDTHSVTLDVSPANSVGAIVIGGGASGTLSLGAGSYSLTDAGNLTVNAGASLNMNTATFTVGGTTSTAGIITDASNTGISTFTGLFTKSGGSWTSTSVTSATNLVFTNGFTNTSGSFSAGAATFGAGTTITATTSMSFNNTITGNGALSINGNGGVTISGNSNATIAGNLSILSNSSLFFSAAPTAILSAGANLSISSGATLSLVSTGNLTVAGTTTINGTFIDNTDNGIDTFTGLITNNGTFNTDIVGTGNNIRIDGGFTNSAGASFIVTSLRLNGTITATAAMNIDGTIQTNGASTTIATGVVTVTGIYGVSLTSLAINSGATLNMFSTGTFSVTGTSTIAGTFIDNDNTSSTTFAGLLTVTGTCDVSALSLSTLFINGGLTYTSGSFLCTGATLQSNSTTITNNNPMNFSNGINVTGGAGITFAGPAAVTIGGAVSIVFPVSLTVSGTLIFTNTGNITVTATSTVTGSLTDNENTGTTTFTGAFSSSGNTDFSALSTSHIIFNGGVAHLAGTFNITTATISTDPVFNDIDVTSALNFSGPVNFTGTGTLTVVGAGGLTFSGTTNVSIPYGLTFNNPCTITVSTTGNFTVGGATSMGGNFIDNDNTGITTFTGLLTKYNGAWTTTAVTTPSNMVFTSGVTQTGGTFNAGGASMPTGQTLNSNPGPIMYFNNPLVIGGAGDITISGAGGVNLGGTGINYSIPGNLTLTGTLTISTTGNFSVNGAAAITGSGAFLDNNNNGITTFTGLVTHNSTGTWISTAVTTPANMVFTSGYTNTAGNFTGGGATVGDNQTLAGIVNMSFVNGINVLGNADITIAGTASTGVTFGGAFINYNVRNLTLSGLLTAATSGNLIVTGPTSIIGTGGFLDNNNTGVTTFNGSVIVGSGGTFTATAITGLGNLNFAAGIIQNNTTAGAFSAGTIRTTATQTWSGAGDINSAGIIDINIGTLTNNSTGTVTSGGTLTGTVFIQGINAKLVLGSTSPLTITTLTSTATGNTVDYHATGAATMRGQTYYNLTVSGSGNKIIPNVDINVSGNMTITAGVLYNTTNNRNIILAGNWINNAGTGGFAAGTGLVTFGGSSSQTLGGGFATSFNNFTVNNAAGINQVVNETVGGVLNFISGVITTGSNLMNVSSTGSVTRTNGHINGYLQKTVSTGAGISRTFEVGDAVNYSPATVLFASVTTAGNLTGSASGSEHAGIDYSGLDSSKDVNRFWSFSNSGIIFTTASAALSWVITDVDAGANTANFKTALFNGGAWTLTSFTSPSSTSIQATGLTSLGDIAAGEKKLSFKWTGAAMTSDWNTAANWSGGIPASTYTTIIPNGLLAGRVYPILTGGSGIVKSLVIQSAASLTITNGSLQISGIVTNGGTFMAASGTVEFNGAPAQTIATGTFKNNTIKNLVVSNDLILSDTIIITGTLSVTAAQTLTTNDHLILHSDAFGTARIDELPVNGTGVATAFITGKVMIERYIPLRKAWRLLSAPVKSSGAPSINAAWQEGLTTASSNPNLYPGYGVFITGGTTANGFDQGLTANTCIKFFNNATNNFMSLPSAGTNTAITNYPGYFLYVRGDRSINLMAGASAATTATTLRIKGGVNTGNQASGVNATGMTLLGNPYPSAIDFQTLTRSNVKNSFYVWDPKLSGTYGLGGYVTFSWNSSTLTYDQTTSAGPVSKYIPSGQAILIQSNDGVNPGTITVKESDKTSSGSDNVFSRTASSGQSLRIDLYSAITDTTVRLLDGVLTTYADDNSNGIDNNDAGKLYGSSENIVIKRDSAMLAIERRKTITAADTTFLSLYQLKRQQYKLNIQATGISGTGTTAVIRDSYDNTINNTPLNLDTETDIYFTVNSDPGSYSANRFSIVFTNNLVLPVTFKTIKATRRQQDIAVEWTTENEINIASYEVEKSFNGTAFSKLYSIHAKSANGGTSAYTFADNKPSEGNNYYRVRSTELNGQPSYSRIVNVNMIPGNDIPSITIYPNPVTGSNVSVRFSNIEKGIYNMKLFDAAGQIISMQSVSYDGAAASTTMNIVENLPAGKYQVKLSGDKMILNASLIKK